MLPTETRRTIQELVIRYALEPTLFDVFVEGETDRALIKWFLDRAGRLDVAVYSVGCVNVPDSLVSTLGLNQGSTRSRLIALAEQLAESVKPDSHRVRCIADADFDRHLGSLRQSPLLLYTDYTSMDIYLFQKPLIDKFICLALRRFPISASCLLQEMSRALERLFTIRLANEALGWGMALPNTTHRYMDWKQNAIVMQEDRLVDSYLSKNSRRADASAFQSAMAHAESLLRDGDRANIHGDDFLMLFLIILKRRNHRFGDADILRSVLCGSLEPAFLRNEPLFSCLLAL